MKMDVLLFLGVVAVFVGLFFLLPPSPSINDFYPDGMTPQEYNEDIDKIIKDRKARVKLKNSDKEGFWSVKITHWPRAYEGGSFFWTVTALSKNESDAIEDAKTWHSKHDLYSPIYCIEFEALFCIEYDPENKEHVKYKKKLKNGAATAY